MSPCTQQVYASQSQSVYEKQQKVFKDIKRRNGLQGDNAKRAITPDDPARRQADKENFLIDSIMRLSIDNKARKELATRRCLNSQIGDRLKLSKKPASKAEFSY